MTGQPKLRHLGVLTAAFVLGLVSAPEGRAQSATEPAPGFVPPPLSVVEASRLAADPAARARFTAQLPRRPADTPQPTQNRVVPPLGGSWRAVTAAPVGGLGNPLLLTDGTVMVASVNTPSWYRLTPDKTGSYAGGTWSKLASLPVIGGTQYAPLYHASAVLPDGRVIIMGGEYNGSSKEVWTNLGAIYNPLTNRWQAVAAPAGSGWSQIGDAQSAVLADGTFMLAACCGNPAVDALLDAKTLRWTSTGAPNAGADYQDEQGYELLPDGNVLTIDIWTNFATSGNATNAEQYSPKTGVWKSAGNTPVSLVDPFVCKHFEIGPAVLRTDGSLVAFGGNTGCTTPAADPTAIFESATGKWRSGPNVPAVCGTGGATPCDLADAGAALLPNGNILFDASAGYGGTPTHFFEFTAKNRIEQVADPLFNAGSSGAFYYNFLELPNGQILMTDFTNSPEVYTPAGSPLAGTAPVVTRLPATLAPGSSYKLSGRQLGGRSQGAYYGDDVQMATNYPIIRIINSLTKHVFYARTSDPSTMSVARNVAGTATFTVPKTIESGPATLSVIANGVASPAQKVRVQ